MKTYKDLTVEEAEVLFQSDTPFEWKWDNDLGWELYVLDPSAHPPRDYLSPLECLRPEYSYRVEVEE